MIIQRSNQGLFLHCVWNLWEMPAKVVTAAQGKEHFIGLSRDRSVDSARQGRSFSGWLKWQNPINSEKKRKQSIRSKKPLTDLPTCHSDDLTHWQGNHWLGGRPIKRSLCHPHSKPSSPVSKRRKWLGRLSLLLYFMLTSPTQTNKATFLSFFPLKLSKLFTQWYKESVF